MQKKAPLCKERQVFVDVGHTDRVLCVSLTRPTDRANASGVYLGFFRYARLRLAPTLGMTK